MNDYPPERIVHDIFSLCMDLRAKEMSVNFEICDIVAEINEEQRELIKVTAIVFENTAHKTSWIEGDWRDPLVCHSICYGDDGYNIGALHALCNELKSLKGK